jgi:cyclic dehypoxanthinyl futalosine synthase
VSITEKAPVAPTHEPPRVHEVLEKALDGERITDEDAIALLRSRDLVAVGRVANELRNRLTDP